MMEILIDGVQKISEGKIDHHKNVTAFLVVKIKHGLKRINQKNRLLPVDWRTFKKGKHNVLVELTKDNDRDKKFLVNGRNLLEEGDLNELINSCAQTDQEIEILHLLTCGYKPLEVAKILGIHKQKVSNVRTKLRQRLLEKTNERVRPENRSVAE